MRLRVQGNKEGPNPFDVQPYAWSAYRSIDYGFMRASVHNDTHLQLEQISADSVRYTTLYSVQFTVSSCPLHCTTVYEYHNATYNQLVVRMFSMYGLHSVDTGLEVFFSVIGWHGHGITHCRAAR